jgi:hypothetical protein
LAIVVGTLCPSLDALAQDPNIPQPVDAIEQALLDQPFEIVSAVGNRFEGDRTLRVVMKFADGDLMKVKWAESAKGGDAFNNRPRYEIAAYELQKLFLPEAEFVVPPTVARAFSIPWYRQHFAGAKPTFRDTSSVLVVLQYWLWNVVAFEGYDTTRFQADPDYARGIGNFNVLTYLARHNDSNKGNFFISRDPTKPRVFSVDNGLAFGPDESNRGFEWRYLLVDRLPRSTIDHLRRLDLDDLEAALGVVAQFEIDDNRLVAAQPTAVLDRHNGVRRKGGVVQFGLSSIEIQGVHTRIRRLLKRVDSGKIATF